jgi:hypothetical protein
MKFNDKYHTYTKDNKKYTSVTTFVKGYAKPFDKINVAIKYAKKHKREVEDVIAEWDKISKDALEKGTHYHKLKEDFLINSPCIPIDGEDHLVHPTDWLEDEKVAIPILNLEPGIYPELIIWSDRYKLAGQADRVEITKSGKINIRDYKTSKEIKLNGFKKWDGTVDKMIFPLNDLEDCNFNHYAIQLNTYMYMLKLQNRKLEIGKMIVEHVICEFDGENLEVKEVIEYEIPNLQTEVKLALEHFKSKQEWL